MRLSMTIRMMTALAGAAMVTPAAAGAAPAGAAKKGIEPAADGLLKHMTAYLAGLKSFRVDISTVDENTLTSGEKIQRISDSAVAVQRLFRRLSGARAVPAATAYAGRHDPRLHGNGGGPAHSETADVP